MVICGLGPYKGAFRYSSSSLVQCREQCYEKRERKERCCDKRRYLVRYPEKMLARERRGRAAVRTNGYWICGVFPHMILNLPFSPTDNAQYFTLFKLDTRRCEKPILTGHYILHPQPKSCTCFYADYISFLGENIYYMNIITRITSQKSITLRICKIWKEMWGKLTFLNCTHNETNSPNSSTQHHYDELH